MNILSRLLYIKKWTGTYRNVFDEVIDIKSNWRKRREWHPTLVLLPRKFHGRRDLIDCSPWGHYKSDTTERLHFHFSPSRIGEGNGNPLQCSCLENPRDGKPGGLPSMGSHRVGHDWSDLAAAKQYRQVTQFIRKFCFASISQQI